MPRFSEPRRSGRSQLAIFTPELLEAATRKFTTEQGLRRALERNEFELVFQPEVSLDSLGGGVGGSLAALAFAGWPTCETRMSSCR